MARSCVDVRGWWWSVTGHRRGNQAASCLTTWIQKLPPWKINKLVSVSRRRRLQREDLCYLDDRDSSHILSSTLEKQWITEESPRRSSPDEEDPLIGCRTSQSALSPALLRHLCVWLCLSLAQVTALRVISDLLGLLPYRALRCLILYCENQPYYDWSGPTHCLFLLAAVSGPALLHQGTKQCFQELKVKVHATLIATVYRRIQTGSCCSSAPPENWEQDCELVAGLLVSLPATCSSSLQGALCVCLICRELGLAANGAGLALLLLLLHLKHTVRRRAQSVRALQEALRAEGGLLMHELIAGIRTVKLFVLEEWFHSRLRAVRAKELDLQRILGYMTAFSLLDHVSVPFLVCLCGLGVYVMSDDGNILTASQLSSVCLLTALRRSGTTLTETFKHLTQGWNSLLRLNHFLFSEKVLPAENEPVPVNEHKRSQAPMDQGVWRSEVVWNDGEGGDYPPGQAYPTWRVCVRSYLRACDWGWVGLAVFWQVCVCVLCVCRMSVLSVLTREAKEVQGIEEWRQLRQSGLALYAVTGLLQALCVCCVGLAVSRGSLRASLSIHGNHLLSWLRLPLRCHWIAAPGRAARSLLQSIHVIDDAIPAELHAWLSGWLQLCAACLLIGYNSSLFLLAVPPLFYLFLIVQSSYQSACAQLRTMMGTSFSSLSSIISKSCTNDIITTCKPDGCQGTTMTCCHGALHDYLLCQYNSILLDGWMEVCIEVLYGCLLFLVALSVVTSKLDSSLAALLFIYTLTMREVLPLLVKSSCNLQSYMGVLWDMEQHTHLQREPLWLDCASKVHAPPAWPSEGRLQFISYQTDSLPTGLTLCIQSKEKVGVLSRSEADLNIITSALFRLEEIKGGVVKIDGIDLCCVGLHELRSRLAVIPKVPLLFSGSLRDNIDPFGCYGDDQVWQVLHRCGLAAWVARLPRQLLHPIGPGGEMASYTERWLLCVTRVLLRSPPLVIFEEPRTCAPHCDSNTHTHKPKAHAQTPHGNAHPRHAHTHKSNTRTHSQSATRALGPNIHDPTPSHSRATHAHDIDPRARSLIHGLLRTEWSQSTVLTLTHDPRSLTHMDRVLVLEGGCVVEFDRPAALLQKRSLFSRLLTEACAQPTEEG